MVVATQLPSSVARIDPESLQDPEQIYLAASLAAARRVEALLTSHGMDYVPQVEELGRTTLFGSVRKGVAFFVETTQAESCRRLLSEAGLGRGVVGILDR
jgi:hypothetical protein